MPLNDLLCRRHKYTDPSTVEGLVNVLADDPPFDGLRLKANKNNSKTWIYRYRTKPPEKKLKQMKLGAYPQMSLAEAREEVQKQKSIRFTHDDPAIYKKECDLQAKLERQLKEQEMMPLGQLVDKYLAIEISNKDIKEKTHKEIRRMLNMPELDELKAQSVIEIQRVNLYEMLVDLMNTRTPGVAERVRQRLKDVFEFGLNSGYLPNDFQIPVPTKQLAKTSNKRERVLTSDEIKKLLAWMPDSKLPDTAKKVIMIALLTGCRSGEIVAARWQDINFENAEWNIPDTKNKCPHKVFLSDQVKSIFQNIPKGKREWVFPSKSKTGHLGQKAVGDPIGKFREDLGIPHWSIHDLRRTFATGVASLGAERTVVRRLLNHTGGSVPDIYDRHSYDGDARRYWGLWADKIES